MSIVEALALSKATDTLDADELIAVLGELEGAVEAFIESVNDYDEWERMDERHDPDGVTQPGFSLVKLRRMLGVK